MQRKQNNFGVKYGNRKSKTEWIANTKKELQGFSVSFEVDRDLKLLSATLKKLPNWKTSSNYGIQGFWFKNSYTSMTDWLLNLVIHLGILASSRHLLREKTTQIQEDPPKGTIPATIDRCVYL